MKKLLKSLSLCLVLLCLVFSFTACNFIRLVVKDPTGGVGANPQDTPIKGEVDGDTYQKTYDVKGVDLKLQTNLTTFSSPRNLLYPNPQTIPHLAFFH